MSWSVSALGKSDAVARKLAADFEKIRVVGPEVQVVETAAASVAAILAAQVPPTAVSVKAFGSQSQSGGAPGPTSYTNSCSIVVEPLYGFVE